MRSSALDIHYVTDADEPAALAELGGLEQAHVGAERRVRADEVARHEVEET